MTQVLPKIALDFTTGILDPRVTFTRATSASNPATYTDASGNLVLATNDQPRFDYQNGICKGLLIEESRTNINGNGAWLGAATGSPGTAPNLWFFSRLGGSIDTITVGSLSENILAFSATANRQVISFNTATVANTTYSGSVYVSSNTGLPFNQLFNAQISPSGTTITRFANGISVTTAYVPVAGDRLTVVAAVASTTGNITWQAGLGILSNVTGTVTLSKVQIEVGDSSTSYIPTSSATTTSNRNADVAVMTGTNFSDWWQATRGGASVLATPSTVSGTRPLIQFDDATADNLIALRGNTTNPELYIVDGGAPQAQLDAGTIVANTAYSLTGWWQTNDCKARQNSGATVSDYTATIPTVTQARIGSDGTNYLNGTIATINYYDSFFGRPIYTRRKNKVFPSLL
jgi:hypothetical protein